MNAAAPKTAQAKPLPGAPVEGRNRVYYPTEYANTWRWLSGVVSVLLGLAFSLAVYGGVHYTAISVFFVGGQLLAWLAVPSYQFGDDNFYVIWRTHSRRMPYGWFAPHLSRAEVHPKGAGATFIYQPSATRESSIFLPLRTDPALEVLFRRRCGVRAPFDANKRSRASSPEITPQELLQLAPYAPKETLENPALLLFSLEDPNLYRAIQATAMQALFMEELLYKTEGQQRVVLCRILHWMIEKRGLALSEVLRRCVEAQEKLTSGELTHPQFEKTLRKIEEDVRKKVVVSHNQTPNALMASFWLHRWLMYDDPARAVGALLNQWQKLEPHLHTELLQDLTKQLR